MLRCCYLGSMGFHILIWHGFVDIEMGVISEEVKRAAIKRESKLNFCFFCVANYRGNPWGDREGHCWKFENCLALKVERILFVLLHKIKRVPVFSPSTQRQNARRVHIRFVVRYGYIYILWVRSQQMLQRSSRTSYPYQTCCNIEFIAACPKNNNNKPQLVPIDDQRSGRQYRKSRLQKLTIQLFYLPEASYPSNQSQHKRHIRCCPLRLTCTSPSPPSSPPPSRGPRRLFDSVLLASPPCPGAQVPDSKTSNFNHWS